jgi:hypothetical protein
MEEFSQEWFELRDLRRRLFSRAVWIPVYGSIYPIKRGEYPEIGHVELGWHDWSHRDTTPYLDGEGRYIEAETFNDNADGRLGFRLVLSQHFNSTHARQVFIHQDFVMAYGLLEEGNHWLRPSEGYEQVIRLTRDDEGAVTFIEVLTCH